MSIKNIFSSLFADQEDNQTINENIEENENSLEESDKLDLLIEDIISFTSKESITIKLNFDDDLNLYNSKLAGYPYLEASSDIPKDSKGNNMFCLVQLNCQELPPNSFYPEKGILQFWIAINEHYGLDFNDPTAGTGHKIVYYPTYQEDISLDTSKELYQFTAEQLEKISVLIDKPMQARAMTFKMTTQSIDPSTNQWDVIFTDKYNQFFPENKVEDVYDIDDQIADYAWESLAESNHRIGGYPHFTQNDIRDEKSDYSILLLQINSDDDFGITWGDSGVANFFITEADLQAKDFSKVLYNWDCC